MSSITYFAFVQILLFYSINTICSEPICTKWNLSGRIRFEHVTICRNVIGINTSAIDQKLSSAADPSTITHVNIEGKAIHLSQSTLESFKNITYFGIDGRNGSTGSEEQFEKSTIESNAFIENKALKDLALKGVNFPTVDNLRGVFQPLFDQLTRIKLLYCSFSQIPSANVSSYDPFQVFNVLSKLEDVEIKYSGLITIPANALQNSASFLQSLNLEHNEIATIDRSAFKGLSKLEKLDLEHNEITSIESGTFDDLTSLTDLYLHDNRISRLPNILFGKSGSMLRNVYFSNNKLTKIHPTTFKGLTKLEWLALKYNEITSIEPGTFDDLISLNAIELDNNRISQLPQNLFVKTPALRSLFIQNNPIRNISARNFTRAPDAGSVLLRVVITEENKL